MKKIFESLRNRILYMESSIWTLSKRVGRTFYPPGSISVSSSLKIWEFPLKISSEPLEWTNAWHSDLGDHSVYECSAIFPRVLFICSTGYPLPYDILSLVIHIGAADENQ